MASKFDIPKLAAALATVALAALCWWFGTRLHPVWWLAWLAPLPILCLATRVRARWAAAAAFAAVALGGFNWWSYLHDRIEVPATVLVLAICGPAAFFTLVVLLYRRLAQRGRHLAAALSVPVLWTALWFVNAITSPNGTFSHIAYTQLDVLALVQVAALTGLWGIGFLVMLAPACAAVACNGAAPRNERIRSLLVGGGIVALALCFGAWRLHAADAGTPMKIGLVSLDAPVRPELSSASGWDVAQRYAAAVRELAAQGARMVVLPEVALTVTEPDVPVLRTLAQQLGISVVIGVDYRPAQGPERNMSLAFAADGSAPAAYNKHHLMVGFEARFTPGTELTMLDGTPRTGLLICKDMDFPATSRAYAALDAQLLPVPAWDFRDDDWMHSRMAILRGVESGFAIARSARDGRITLSDDRGRVLAEASSVGKDAQVVGSLPLRRTHTLYARWGDWFAWLDLVALLALLVMAFVPLKLHTLPPLRSGGHVVDVANRDALSQAMDER